MRLVHFVRRTCTQCWKLSRSSGRCKAALYCFQASWTACSNNRLGVSATPPPPAAAETRFSAETGCKAAMHIGTSLQRQRAQQLWSHSEQTPADHIQSLTVGTIDTRSAFMNETKGRIQGPQPFLPLQKALYYIGGTLQQAGHNPGCRDGFAY